MNNNDKIRAILISTHIDRYQTYPFILILINDQQETTTPHEASTLDKLVQVTALHICTSPHLHMAFYSRLSRIHYYRDKKRRGAIAQRGRMEKHKDHLEFLILDPSLPLELYSVSGIVAFPSLLQAPLSLFSLFSLPYFPYSFPPLTSLYTGSPPRRSTTKQHASPLPFPSLISKAPYSIRRPNAKMHQLLSGRSDCACKCDQSTPSFTSTGRDEYQAFS